MKAGPPGGRAGVAAALLTTVLWLTATAWMRPLMLPDEGRYVGVAWEMLRSGDWLTPTLNGLPYFHKPPLFYWITGAALSVLGPHEWAARTAPLLGGVVAATALFLFVRRWRGPALAWLSLAVLLTQPLLFAGAQFANLDMLVAGCIAATLLSFANAALAIEQGLRPRASLLAGYLFAALGLLAKGLIGVVLPGLVLVAWLVVRGRPRVLLALAWLPGLAVFAAVAAPWFVAMQSRFPDFLHYFFVVQHFQRYTAGGFNNPAPFWFYLAVLPLATLPWSAWLPAAAQRASRGDADGARLRQLMWLWLLLVTVFFSLPRSKLAGYILPVTVPLAFLVADAALAAAQSGRGRRLLAASAAAAALACLTVVVAVTAAPSKSLREVGRTLAQRRTPEEPVVFLHGYYYDLPFYARLAAPPLVLDDWDRPALAARDDWHRELLDAQRFRRGQGDPVLLLPSQLAGVLCASRATWLVGGVAMLERYPLLAQAAVIARQGDTLLWRLPAGAVTAAPCPGTPSASSAGM
ncbi:glycosyltransferase family 39 protein [Ramlibacter sp.]|uniref:glycosyltransferase family 39 protein n=1 Tax=Ramlibacter sp. TaxID=1917967 RepID=UPI002CB30969|nr:glycosyltransferase family 39 protein [Ramlibacter sp.]HWI82012.1 glycosyltransferase family 39 protein [Ramlibacter sp.]